MHLHALRMSILRNRYDFVLRYDCPIESVFQGDHSCGREMNVVAYNDVGLDIIQSEVMTWTTQRQDLDMRDAEVHNTITRYGRYDVRSRVKSTSARFIPKSNVSWVCG